MKTLYQQWGWLIMATLTISVLSCKKDNYLTDGGIHNVNTPLSTYDYLKQHSAHYFDTTILIIDHFNLKDSVNKSATFFAFTNFSVKLMMTNLKVNSLEELYDSVSSKLITQYLFGDVISLDNTSSTPVSKTNWAGVLVPCAVKTITGSYAVWLSGSAPVFNYNSLQYIMVNGVLDGAPGAPEGDPVDVAMTCQTTGIKTATGTTLHVLANNAPLAKR
ncbi:hypothetical protein [Chitinophaga sp.]|uniref:hypothetical protein n=1 Tax=Chitinophaga sp. TaxID=1869181 RepID=UPI002F957BCC